MLERATSFRLISYWKRLPDADISSEAVRKEAEANAKKDAENCKSETGEDAGGKKIRQREPKLPKLKIDREQLCPLNKDGLPDDLKFKGYEEVVIQDLIIITDTVNTASKSIIHHRSTRAIAVNYPKQCEAKANMDPVSAR
jgi:hypothetical protein